ncbi:MAG TPA: asparagine synthase (glutamine-hydrolyzing) [Candidatus Binatia bacterium]|jgi:asparagine synthase (glutamine-hydrolysing)|nr:asparagine synthase (glutamine-hydrolyzing) [Candidatus Binatia bacterium]
MCGICGKLHFDEQSKVEPQLLERMMGALSHRGPDGVGHYLSGRVGLGHTRLAIIDLSTGDQPIANEDRTIWVVFNGEIYNFKQLRDELEQKGHVFRTRTDTEVIVHLYEEYGIESLSRLRGMFAFALWDQKEEALLLARDRVGIKPLYYANTGDALVFGSEIKALLADPAVKCEVELQSVDKFLTHLCLPGRETLWKGIYKIDPGFYLLAKRGGIKLEQYWDLHFHERNGWKSMDEAGEELYHLIKQTVRDHMISDVPVGFLLSGGVDSTVVLSCAATETSKKISTFTVGFDNAGFEDERVYARLAAARFGTEQHEITITPREFWDFLPSLVWHMEEPVCDPPAVSLHYVSKLARQHVKVLLSGEGGDEAFGGYYTYRNFLLLERAKASLGPFQSVLSAGLAAAGYCPPLRRMGKYSPFAATPLADYYYSRAASPFSFFNRSKEALYTSSFSGALSPGRSTEVIRNLFRQVEEEPLLNQMQYIDTKTSLADDLLVKADRITMGNSLELRVPFLDHVLLEFAVGLPASYRVKRLATKRLLKHAFQNRIPKEIIKRRKAGFPLPIETWLQKDLKPQVHEVLLSRQCLERGYFRKEGIEKLLSLSAQGRPLAKELFSLLTLELLLAQFKAAAHR